MKPIDAVKADIVSLQSQLADKTLAHQHKAVQTRLDAAERSLRDLTGQPIPTTAELAAATEPPARDNQPVADFLS